MTGSSLHPSPFALDRAVLGAGTPDVREHLETCDVCRAYVERLRAPSPVPDWVRDAERHVRIVRWSWGSGVGVAVLAAAAFIVSRLGLMSPAPTGAYLASKGSPAVAVYVKRGESVRLWDGRSSVRPGDHLRLRIVPEGFVFATLAERGSAVVPHVLQSIPLDPGSEAIEPGSLVVDDAPGPEQLIVALSNGPIPPERLTGAPNVASSTLWMTTLVLPKETP